MKKNIYISFLLLFCGINLYGSNPIEFCEKNFNSLKLTNAEIIERFSRYKTDAFKNSYEIASKLKTKEKFLSEANGSMFHTVLFLRVEPDIDKGGKLIYHLVEDKIALWNDGYTYIWDKSERASRDMPNYGDERAIKYKNVINKKSKDECLFFIVIYGYNKTHTPYLGHIKNNKFVILDQNNKEYHSIEELIISEMGSVENYIERYKMIKRHKFI